MKRFKRYKCTNKKRLFWFISILLLFSFCLVGLFKAQITDAREPLKIIEITVAKGDSLWSIAERYDDNSMDLRKYIDLIQAYNDMRDTILQPGQSLKIPIY